MRIVSKTSGFLLPLALLAVPVALAAQEAASQAPSWSDSAINVYGERLPARSEMTEGPKIDGIISARKGDRIQVTAEDGTRSTIFVSQDTRIRSKGGFLGLSSNKLATDSLLNGLPVSVATLQWSGGLFADKVDLKDKDLKVASMIRNGTDQRFAEQTAATEALRSRVADIDNYNVKTTTNVNFEVGRADLSAEAKGNLCATANTASGMDNALLLVVGYTDSTGSDELNQVLSEKRATKVVNYLQQSCGWKPYRMLTPTGMSEADPLADNETDYGKAQNRRVAVNVLVSKAVDGIADDGFASNSN